MALQNCDLTLRQASLAAGDEAATGSPAVAGYGRRYGMLDSWRGLAALGVLLGHISDSQWMQHGHACVMLFFIVSGYCIAAAIDSAAEKGMPIRTFIWRRWKRIYPPYFFSIIFFLLTRLLKTRLTGTNDLLRFEVSDWIQNLTMTQWSSLIANPISDPVANPVNFMAIYWSLNYEEQFYLVMCLLIPLLALRPAWGMRAIVPLIGVSFLWILTVGQTYHGLFIEYFFQFGLGCLVFYRLCRMPSKSQRRLCDVSLVLIGSALLIDAVFLHNIQRSSALFSKEILVVVPFAALLLALRPFDRAVCSSRIARYVLIPLGAISYSLYLTHQCMMRITSEVAGAVFGAESPVATLIFRTVVHLCIAAAFWAACERPFLNKPYVPRQCRT